ncbi:unnamed protein product [Caenorhabditis angaria]|uniref:Uncharacterized protein n=1 Tax=Caenorhabditis angaria TaxID=860376 RepID=A0A9P1IVA2_9PELO|nr:unnamed protein product [Caenorhabditis angaria]
MNQFLVTYILENTFGSIFTNFIFTITVIAIVIFSFFLSYLTHFSENVEFYDIASMELMIIIDLISLILLIYTSRLSKIKYNLKIGLVSLEKKFQLSQVYTWSRSVLPSFVFAKIFRFVSLFNVIVIKYLFKLVSAQTISIAYSIFNVGLDIFIISLTISAIYRQKKLRKGLFFWSHNSKTTNY